MWSKITDVVNLSNLQTVLVVRPPTTLIIASDTEQLVQQPKVAMLLPPQDSSGWHWDPVVPTARTLSTSTYDLHCIALS